MGLVFLLGASTANRRPPATSFGPQICQLVVSIFLGCFLVDPLPLAHKILMFFKNFTMPPASCVFSGTLPFTFPCFLFIRFLVKLKSDKIATGFFRRDFYAYLWSDFG